MAATNRYTRWWTPVALLTRASKMRQYRAQPRTGSAERRAANKWPASLGSLKTEEKVAPMTPSARAPPARIAAGRFADRRLRSEAVSLRNSPSHRGDQRSPRGKEGSRVTRCADIFIYRYRSEPLLPNRLKRRVRLHASEAARGGADSLSAGCVSRRLSNAGEPARHSTRILGREGGVSARPCATARREPPSRRRAIARRVRIHRRCRALTTGHTAW